MNSLLVRDTLFSEVTKALIIPGFSSTSAFESLAMEIFRYQAQFNPVYRQFLDLLQTPVHNINSIFQIPFMPVSFFKQHDIRTGNREWEITFKSSGTGQMERSVHRVGDAQWYRKVFHQLFTTAIAPPEDCAFFALLPSYLEQGESSLVYMVEHLKNASARPDLPFYLSNYKQLMNDISKSGPYRKILFGVTYALLDLAETAGYPLQDVTIIETGGMKGRRKEITRTELHKILIKRLQPAHVCSEYGMTELLSQAYAIDNDRFIAGTLMSVLARDLTDPFEILPSGRQGGINIIDLANLDSCSFIATDDLGRVYEDGTFEVTGRIDHSDIRGCSLLS